MTTRIELFSLFLKEREINKELKVNQILFERMKPYKRGNITDFKIKPVASDIYEVSIHYLIPINYLECEDELLDDNIRLKLRKAKALINMNGYNNLFMFDLYDCLINDYDLIGDNMLSIHAQCHIGLNRITKKKGIR